MKIYRTVKHIVESKEIDECICDFCSKSIDSEWGHIMSDISEFTISPGYGSKYDSVNFSFDICDDCIDSVILKNSKDNV